MMYHIRVLPPARSGAQYAAKADVHESVRYIEACRMMEECGGSQAWLYPVSPEGEVLWSAHEAVGYESATSFAVAQTIHLEMLACGA